MYLVFAWRYFRSKKSTTAINVIAWISVLAITVGTAALIVVLSVFNGFEGLVKGLYGDFYSDMRITPASGKYFSIPKNVEQKLNAVQPLAKTFVIEEKAVITNGDLQSIVYLKGVDLNFSQVSDLKKHIIRGSFNIGSTETPQLVLGSGIENALGAYPESLNELTIYLPNRSSTSASIADAMNSYNARNMGSFQVQQEFDNKYAFTNLPFMQYMLDLQPDQYSAIELRLKENSERDIEKAKKILSNSLGKGYIVQTRYEQNQGLYSIMQMEKWVVYGILCLILIVAAFNMIGALTMLVLEKQKDIAVLKAMGVDEHNIQKVFLYAGGILAFIGGLTGTIIAVIICWMQQTFHLIKLEGGSFIIEHYPVKMLPLDFLLVFFTVLIITILAAWYPSKKAAAQPFNLKS